MLKSMTGFGAGAAEDDSYRVLIEVKSVNQRYLEIGFHMPHKIDAFAEGMKKKIKEYVSRGKLDVNVSLTEKKDKTQSVRVDKNLAIAYHKALNELSDLLHLPRPDDITQVAAFPDIIKVEDNEESFEGLEAVLAEAMDEALRNLTHMREEEGANLKQDFIDRLERMENMVERIAGLAPQIVAAYRERLQKTLGELLSAEEIDQNRIIQETAIYSDRVNFTEEMVRLKSHFAQFRKILESDEPVGRKLDFLIQEMNREINTTASKANNAEAAQIVVDVKSEIEKLREQIQNLE
ncbi:YicC/YloC family endoribonuclease [Schwartzia succinivorans]|uniref:YicC/YloC family endoribonuclease n=1 Tax=Schwartzia succinivorans TaxID=55507 RepID=UPI0023525630|nr:YicC/YloC family endoribonuclease [Schwartzia succinivorans]